MLVVVLALAFICFAASEKHRRDGCEVSIYWGFGQGRSLGSFCNSDEGINIIIIGGLVPILGKTYPSGLLGNECIVNEDGSFTDACSNVAQDIKICQEAGVKVLVGFTNYGHNWGIPNKADAFSLASALWNSYGAGTSDSKAPRPFGDVKVDGWDFDVEKNPQNQVEEHLGDLINALRGHFSEDSSKTYYISGAPQCAIPDPNMNNAMMQAKFDYIWIQFYNNYCAAADLIKDPKKNPNRKSDKHPGNYNLDRWPAYLANGASSGASLFVGLPASPGAAQSWDFVTAATLPHVISESPGVGGVMLWNSAFSDAQIHNGCTYAQNVAHVLSSGQPC